MITPQDFIDRLTDHKLTVDELVQVLAEREFFLKRFAIAEIALMLMATGRDSEYPKDIVNGYLQLAGSYPELIEQYMQQVVETLEL